MRSERNASQIDNPNNPYLNENRDYYSKREMVLWMLKNGFATETSHDSTMSGGESVWAIEREAFDTLCQEYGLGDVR